VVAVPMTAVPRMWQVLSLVLENMAEPADGSELLEGAGIAPTGHWKGLEIVSVIPCSQGWCVDTRGKVSCCKEGRGGEAG
jgi:hypothetical protein